GLRYEVFAGIEEQNWVALVCSSFGKGLEEVMMEELWAKLQPLFEGMKEKYQPFENGPLGGRSGPNGSIGIFQSVPLKADLMASALFDLIQATKEEVGRCIKEWGPERVGGFTRMAGKFK
ncbi:MAG TPA: hypothetical protein V6C82_06840, partial [Chroococcales cyanobacterium]